jgi:sulfite reductase (NADPH) hemoprotein beta-component
MTSADPSDAAKSGTRNAHTNDAAANNPVEKIKQQSAQLRGEIVQSLSDGITGALRDSDQTVIKYHGSYQQDDRDVREARRMAKLEPEFSFMIRTRTPGGVVSPSQWLALDQIAVRFASRGLRITSRQALQFHGVIKTELKATMQAINATLMDTLAACGDVNRNVTIAVNPAQSQLHAQVYAAGAALSERLLPNTRAYFEIWLDEQRVVGADEAATEAIVDPVYGESYLPRKFKIGFVIPPVNDVDIYTQDLGFIAVVQGDQLLGYNVTVGGGMGASHNDSETFPRLADTLGFIEPNAVQAVAIAVITTQRDFGNRLVRKRARLKYTIEDRGIAWFKAEVETRSDVTFTSARAIHFSGSGDQFGWQQSTDGSLSLGLRIIAGRITDTPEKRLLTGLRRLATLLLQSPSTPPAQLRLTPNQNLVIANIDPKWRAEIDRLVAEFALDTHQYAGSVLTHAMACVALPTCGLAMAEAERYLPEFAEQLQQRMAQLNLSNAPLQLRISGCPNGCSRPYASEVALVGKAPGRYNLMLGGDHIGTRLNQIYRENLDTTEILAALTPLLADYAKMKLADERFGDFCVRTEILPSSLAAATRQLSKPFIPARVLT